MLWQDHLILVVVTTMSCCQQVSGLSTLLNAQPHFACLGMRLIDCCSQVFIPQALEELKRVDVINHDAQFGREADFKLGNEQERVAKVGAASCICSFRSPMVFRPLYFDFR